MSTENQAQENKMGVMPENRLLLTMAIPIVISMLVQALYNVVDSVFVAQLSEDALNAVSLAFPVQNLMIAVAVGTGAINDMAAECEQRVEAGEGVAPKGTKRILYTGTPMAVPNWKLFNLIEKAGGVVVGEESCTGSRYYKDLVDESGETVDEMLDAIAERYFKINCAVFTPNDQRMKDIVQMAKDLHADGIVDVALQFCTLYEMESFAVEKAAEEAGIPFMHITTDYAGEDAGQLQTRIEAFLETI